MMDSGGFGTSLMTMFGPLLLLAVLAWVLLRNRKAKRDEIDRTERATRDLYEKEEAARRREDDGIS